MFFKTSGAQTKYLGVMGDFARITNYDNFHWLTGMTAGVDTTVELQWLKHLGNHENMFQTGVVRAHEC